MLARPAAHAPAAPARQELTHPPSEGAAPAHPATAPETNRAEGQEVPQQRSGRLTADERKALRRQIDEARDIYRPLLQHSH
jgi:hypothetical protein